LSQSAQSRSLTSLNDADIDLTIDKPAIEDNMSLLILIYASLNNLYEKLSRLDYLLNIKNIKIIYHRNIGEKNEN